MNDLLNSSTVNLITERLNKEKIFNKLSLQELITITSIAIKRQIQFDISCTPELEYPIEVNDGDIVWYSATKEMTTFRSSLIRAYEVIQNFFKKFDQENNNSYDGNFLEFINEAFNKFYKQSHRKTITEFFPYEKDPYSSVIDSYDISFCYIQAVLNSENTNSNVLIY